MIDFNLPLLCWQNISLFEDNNKFRTQGHYVINKIKIKKKNTSTTSEKKEHKHIINITNTLT